MKKINPFLWFDSEAEEAAKFYVGIFKNSKIEFAIARMPSPAREPRALPRFEFASICVDSWLRCLSVFNHI